jgi:BMFP domain-containing protein YqiC
VRRPAALKTRVAMLEARLDQASAATYDALTDYLDD